MATRNLHSPDDADAICLFGHVLRHKFGTIAPTGLPPEVEEKSFSEEGPETGAKPLIVEQSYESDGFDDAEDDLGPHDMD